MTQLNFHIRLNTVSRLELRTPLLRVMVLQQTPPFDMSFPEHAHIVFEGARLRERMPAFLVGRRALVDQHCPLITPLLALVHARLRCAFVHRGHLGDRTWRGPINLYVVRGRGAERALKLPPSDAASSTDLRVSRPSPPTDAAQGKDGGRGRKRW
jgi:hypothetical protein